MPALSEYDISTLAARFAEWGYPPSAAAKVLRRYYETGGESIDGPQIARGLRARLDAEFPLRSTQIVTRRLAADGTVKFLVGLPTNQPATRLLHTARAQSVECVLMPSHRPDRAAGCVSSQVGCAMGCDFCASTKAGVERSLTAGEIVEQFLTLRAEAISLGRRLQTFVFMGMGEPLLNYDAVMTAIRRIAGQDLGAIGWRQVMVSTVGIVPGIDRLATEGVPLTLAISLHAPDDDTRSAIVPTGRKYKVADILAAARRYQAAAGRPVNIEYTMLAGVNDSDAQAKLLADLLATDERMHVNLIPYNWIGPGVSGRVYQRPADERMRRFAEILTAGGVVAHFRRTRGDDIEGACGQLRETVATGRQ
ncbi:MAG TPA: 23S rRNA (adenine(2503)-C(2))-methyltransferase RlmN [Tepidisphaeraceae bacterium]|nr:23S rRNA (adenine(2503)-C(2))-methyltransferase RlmN [Tepidisphaeraceae bacterium]